MFGCEKAPRHKKARMPQPQSTTRRCFTNGGGTDAFARPPFAPVHKNTRRRFASDKQYGAGGTLG
jgi:tripartite-type tricarboxylate transporter receptor subunit TctC